MDNFGLNNGFTNNNNTLAELLKRFTQPQPEAVQANEPQRSNSAIRKLEVDSESELEYIEDDTSGSLQMVYCRPEKRVYVGRYNFSRKKTDWEAFLSEGEVKLSQKPDASEEMGQVAIALSAVVNELKTMRGEIQEIKNIKPVVVEPQQKEPVKKNTARATNGQFAKKGEA